MCSWVEFLEKNQGKDLNGKRIWVTDTRLHEGFTMQRIRSLPPTLVEIANNDELPINIEVYQSNYHFRKVGRNGELLKKIIKPFDSTGYRTLQTPSVYVFETEDEANDKYNQQLDVIVEQLQQHQEALQKVIDKTLSEKIER